MMPLKKINYSLSSLVVSLMLFAPLSVVAEENSEDQEEIVAFARFVPERLDDFAWENDLIAFRAYGPALRDGGVSGGIDCWLKRVKYPVINKWYDEELNQGKSYHVDHGEGLDNYHTGASAGTGGTAIWIDGQAHALGTYTEWEILEESPNKVVFVLRYEIEIDGVDYREDKEITVEAGKRLFKAKSTFWKNGEIAVDLPIAIGITTHDGSASGTWSVEQGWAACWETIDGDGLGTAVLVDPTRVSTFALSENSGPDTANMYVVTKTNTEGRVEYFAGYGWAKAKEITSMDEWVAYLNNFKF